ncbi:MAG: DUF1275 domain-containing protein [Thiomicrospira sp.]|nr:MAG: DUF1275 domain-containing protein [Thiomicrospira sp.]
MPYPKMVSDYSKPIVFAIAFIMAAIAGYINSIMLIEFGMPVSQMTGIASHLSESGFYFEWQTFMSSLLILFSFIAGAFLSGWIIDHGQYQEDRSYGIALFFNGLILLISTLFMFYFTTLALMFSAVACGLQNAMVASYKGLQVRTTHVTGISTDIGVHLAHRFKNKTPFSWRVWLLFCILAGFILGGLFGILCLQLFGNFALMIPALTDALLAILYFHFTPSTSSPH